MKLRRMLLASALLAVIAAVAAAPAVTHADTVIVDDGIGGTHMMGAIRYALGQDGQFTGALGRSEPAGPVTVYIYRSINAEIRQAMTELGIVVNENSAYLWPESAPYNAESMKRLTFLRAINPAQSDEALAAGFGLEVSAPAAPPQP